MAVSSPLNPLSAGGLAGRPTRQVGGVRRQNETPLTFQNRLGGQPAGVTPPPMQTREDRVLASRMDGTLDAKRSAFNAAAKGQFMDEAGNIAATSQNFGAGAAAPAPSAPSPQFASAPDGRGGSKMVQIPATPPMVGPPTPQAINKKTIANRMAAGRAKAEAERPGAVNAMTPPAQTPKVTPPVYAPGSLEARAQALGNAMQINNSRHTAATVAKAQDLKMAPHRALNASMSAPLPAVKQMQTGLPLADAAGPGANLNTTPLTPAEQLAESVRPGSVAAHRGVTPPPMAPDNSHSFNQFTFAARADGGPVQAGKPYLVGERGPEAVVPAPPAAPAPAAPKAVTPPEVGHKRSMLGSRPGHPRGSSMVIAKAMEWLTGSGQARADGGPVQGGKPYLVGERGPELIVPQQAGTVIPNHQLTAKVTAPSFKFKPAAALMAARG